jgi:hypothetical protein
MFAKLPGGGISQIPPVKLAACFCEPLKAVDLGAA